MWDARDSGFTLRAYQMSSVMMWVWKIVSVPQFLAISSLQNLTCPIFRGYPTFDPHIVPIAKELERPEGFWFHFPLRGRWGRLCAPQWLGWGHGCLVTRNERELHATVGREETKGSGLWCAPRCHREIGEGLRLGHRSYMSYIVILVRSTAWWFWIPPSQEPLEASFRWSEQSWSDLRSRCDPRNYREGIITGPSCQITTPWAQNPGFFLVSQVLLDNFSHCDGKSPFGVGTSVHHLYMGHFL